MIIKKITKNTPEEYLLEQAGCKKCGHCCGHGSGFVLKNELKKIADYLGLSEAEFERKYLEEVEFFNTKQHRFKMHKQPNMPHGKCVLLAGKNLCSIHKVKPLHCRISTCEANGEEVQAWFRINFFLNPNDPESVRQYSSYIKTGGLVLPGAKLDEIIPDKETLKKIISYERLK